MIEKLLAGLALLACIALLVRMALPERLRWTVDHHARRIWQAMQESAHRLWHWRTRRRQAAQQTKDAIRRASGQATRDGNVIRPKAFKEPRKPH